MKSQNQEALDFSGIRDIERFQSVNPQQLDLSLSLSRAFQMVKRLVPLLNRVLVEKIIPSSKTNTGIMLPEKSTKVRNLQIDSYPFHLLLLVL